LGLLIFESALIYLCGVAAIRIRFAGEAGEAMIARQGWVKLLAAMVVAQVAFYLFDLYDFKAIGQRSALPLRIMQALGLSAVALALLFYAIPQMMLGRGVFALALALMLTTMTGWRVVATWLLGHPRLAERVLILGTDLPAIAIAREIMQRREHGYEVIGFVGQDFALVGQSLINPHVIGVMDDLEELVRRGRPDRIVVALSDRRGRLPLDLLLKLKVRDEIQVEESSRFFERLTGKISTDRLQPGQLVFAETSRWMRLYRRLRRLFDIVSTHDPDGDRHPDRISGAGHLHAGARRAAWAAVQDVQVPLDAVRRRSSRPGLGRRERPARDPSRADHSQAPH
jgi:FlaA1/EpsC-like NDP-sugar epimerase